MMASKPTKRSADSQIAPSYLTSPSETPSPTSPATKVARAKIMPLKHSKSGLPVGTVEPVKPFKIESLEDFDDDGPEPLSSLTKSPESSESKTSLLPPEKFLLEKTEELPKLDPGSPMKDPEHFAFKEEEDGEETEDEDEDMAFEPVHVAGLNDEEFAIHEAKVAKAQKNDDLLQAFNDLPMPNAEESNIGPVGDSNDGLITFTLSRDILMSESNANLQSTEAGGDLQLTTDIGGDLYMDLFGGDLHMDSFGGNLHMDSFRGDLYMDSFGGNLHMDSFGGDLYMDSFGGNLHMDSFGDDLPIDFFGLNDTATPADLAKLFDTNGSMPAESETAKSEDTEATPEGSSPNDVQGGSSQPVEVGSDAETPRDDIGNGEASGCGIPGDDDDGSDDDGSDHENENDDADHESSKSDEELDGEDSEGWEDESGTEEDLVEQDNFDPDSDADTIEQSPVSPETSEDEEEDHETDEDESGTEEDDSVEENGIDASFKFTDFLADTRANRAQELYVPDPTNDPAYIPPNNLVKNPVNPFNNSVNNPANHTGEDSSQNNISGQSSGSNNDTNASSDRNDDGSNAPSSQKNDFGGSGSGSGSGSGEDQASDPTNYTEDGSSQDNDSGQSSGSKSTININTSPGLNDGSGNAPSSQNNGFGGSSSSSSSDEAQASGTSIQNNVTGPIVRRLNLNMSPKLTNFATINSSRLPFKGPGLTQSVSTDVKAMLLKLPHLSPLRSLSQADALSEIHRLEVKIEADVKMIAGMQTKVARMNASSDYPYIFRLESGIIRHQDSITMKRIDIFVWAKVAFTKEEIASMPAYASATTSTPRQPSTQSFPSAQILHPNTKISNKPPFRIGTSAARATGGFAPAMVPYDGPMAMPPNVADAASQDRSHESLESATRKGSYHFLDKNSPPRADESKRKGPYDFSDDNSAPCAGNSDDDSNYASSNEELDQCTDTEDGCPASDSFALPQLSGAFLSDEEYAASVRSEISPRIIAESMSTFFSKFYASEAGQGAVHIMEFLVKLALVYCSLPLLSIFAQSL